MWCNNCNSDLTNCECEDLEERLDRCTNFTYLKCKLCGKHRDRCRCRNPRLELNR